MHAGCICSDLVTSFSAQESPSVWFCGEAPPPQQSRVKGSWNLKCLCTWCSRAGRPRRGVSHQATVLYVSRVIFEYNTTSRLPSTRSAFPRTDGRVSLSLADAGVFLQMAGAVLPTAPWRTGTTWLFGCFLLTSRGAGHVVLISLFLWRALVEKCAHLRPHLLRQDTSVHPVIVPTSSGRI